ncbi:MAG TPA: LuxR C-terminal-related transcriptional regulator [Ktedonobacteraceae bacterium]
MLEPSLLVTKFTIPPVRARLLPRGVLIERLNQSSALPLVLLSAGAGFGKTTLLAAWASQYTQPVAWLTLDPLDNDPQRFWSAVVTALRTRFPTLGEEVFARLQEPQPPQLIPLLTSLVNDLVACGQEVVLIVDDYHLIEEPSIHASLSFLLDHAPSCLHLLLSSRIDPPLALSRWRARGQMAEIRDRDLRVSEQEGSLFLQQVMRVHLDAEDEHRLVQRTEGWLVGLQLAALSLSRQDDPSAWVSAFRGTQRLIQDYLQDEILARQKPAIRRFLLRVCILPRMNAELCQAVTGKADSQQMLEALERNNLFVVALDEQRQWYRLHDLFREALLARLRVTQPELLPRLNEQAAHWYIQQGLLPDAIEVALSAGAFECAAELIERSINPGSLRNAYHTLCRWLGQLPKEILQARPELSFQYGQALMFTSPRRAPAAWARIEPPLQWAEQGFEAAGQWERLGETLELHATLAFFQGDLASAFALTQQASPLLSQHSMLYAASLGLVGLEHVLAGHLEAAWQRFLESQRIALSRADLPVRAATTLLLGEVCRARGELQEASRSYHQILAHEEKDPEIFQQQLMTETGDRELFFVSWAYHNLAQLAYEWNDLEAAQQYLSQAQARGEDPEQEIHILTSGGLIRTRLLHRRGETVQAHNLLDRWERQARFPWVLRTIHAAQARLQLEVGNLPGVERWSRSKDDFFGFSMRERDRVLPSVFQEEEALLVVRLLLAQEKAEEALQELAPWKEQAQTQGRVQTLLEILILEALAHFAARSLPPARSTLLQALRLAQPENYQRLFLDEGRPMQALLKSTLKEIQEPELALYVRRLLEAFEREQGPAASSPVSDSSALLEPLTSQEQRVLDLLAEGASNQQIATQLVIELSTVKKHMTNLLAKLGATNRTQAVVRAREYDLL